MAIRYAAGFACFPRCLFAPPPHRCEPHCHQYRRRARLPLFFRWTPCAAAAPACGAADRLVFPLALLQRTPWISIDLGSTFEVQKVVITPPAALFGTPATTPAHTFTVRAGGLQSGSLWPSWPKPGALVALKHESEACLTRAGWHAALAHPACAYDVTMPCGPPQVRVTLTKSAANPAQPDAGIDRRWGAHMCSSSGAELGGRGSAAPGI